MSMTVLRKVSELFSDTRKGTTQGEVQICADRRSCPEWTASVKSYKAKLEEEIELSGWCRVQNLIRNMVSKGELSPVFFGSALTNFGVETFLKHFLKMTTSPLPRKSDKGEIDPMEEGDFSAFVFKIQANMNKAHRDRIAFMRICSGRI